MAIHARMPKTLCFLSLTQELEKVRQESTGKGKKPRKVKHTRPGTTVEKVLSIFAMFLKCTLAFYLLCIHDPHLCCHGGRCGYMQKAKLSRQLSKLVNYTQSKKMTSLSQAVGGMVATSMCVSYNSLLCLSTKLLA